MRGANRSTLLSTRKCTHCTALILRRFGRSSQGFRKIPMQPIDIVERVKATYKNYIKTAFPIIDPALRGKVFEKIDDANLLWRGPYLSLQRPYFRTAETVSDLSRAFGLKDRSLDAGGTVPDKGVGPPQ